MKKIVMALAVVMFAGLFWSQPAEARCWWNGYRWHCTHHYRHHYWRTGYWYPHYYHRHYYRHYRPYYYGYYRPYRAYYRPVCTPWPLCWG